jgi:glycerate kinase
MKVVIAIDSFKGSLTSTEAGLSAKSGILKAFPDAEVCVMPIADGGEGTVYSLSEGLYGKIHKVPVKGPLFEDIYAEYGAVGDTAIIEMASAAGLCLVPNNKRNPMNTTTYGVGQLIREAICSRFRKFIIGIGGSATNDCGIGMLSALGFEFLDKDKNSVFIGAEALSRVCEISSEKVMPELYDCEFKIACDVENVLCGELGCSQVFAKQKGASDKEIAIMDGYIEKYAETVKGYFPSADKNFKGAGAAGGLGFAFKTFLSAELVSGISLVLDMIGLEKEIKDADLIITGEGRIDSQSIMGKAPCGVAELCKKYKKPVVALAGSVGYDTAELHAHGIDSVFSILHSPSSLDEAMQKQNAMRNLSHCAEQVARLFKAYR